MSIMIGNRLVHVTGAQVQPDWNENDQSRPSHIRNKPDVITEDEKGAPNGVASLDSEGKISPDQLRDEDSNNWVIIS